MGEFALSIAVSRCRVPLMQSIKLRAHDEQERRAIVIGVKLLQKFLHDKGEHSKCCGALSV